MHTSCFRTNPTDRQCALYDAYPDANGFSDAERDEELFQAVLVLALVQTIPSDPDHEPVRTTYVFYPKRHEPWVVKEIGRNAEDVFGWLKRDSKESRVRAAQFMGSTFQALRLGHLVLQMPEVPPHWVAFGFRREDPIPDWMRSRLLDP